MVVREMGIGFGEGNCYRTPLVGREMGIGCGNVPPYERPESTTSFFEMHHVVFEMYLRILKRK